MADALDLLTPEEAIVAVNSPNPSPTVVSRLEQMVTGISREVDRLCGPVVQRTVTERHDGVNGPILLRSTPVVSITSVSEWAGSTETELVAGDWYLDAVQHRVRLYRQSGGYDTSWLSGSRSVEVTYVAGRAASTAAVDAGFKLAAASALRVMWQQEAPRWAQRPDFPSDVEEIPGFISIDELVRRRLPTELLPPAVA